MKTSELQGAALDWAVAKCEGMVIEIRLAGACGRPLYVLAAEQGHTPWVWKPSIDWSQAGPIIEREKISVWFVEEYADEVGKVMCKAEWYAEYREGRPYHSATGPTPLVAAMRYYVASKLGEYVDVPF